MIECAKDFLSRLFVSSKIPKAVLAARNVVVGALLPAHPFTHRFASPNTIETAWVKTINDPWRNRAFVYAAEELENANTESDFPKHNFELRNALRVMAISQDSSLNEAVAAAIIYGFRNVRSNIGGSEICAWFLKDHAQQLNSREDRLGAMAACYGLSLIVGRDDIARTVLDQASSNGIKSDEVTNHQALRALVKAGVTAPTVH